jgi:hypothetical protein
VCDGADWIQLAQDSPVTNTYEHGDEHIGSLKGKELIDQLNDY